MNAFLSVFRADIRRMLKPAALFLVAFAGAQLALDWSLGNSYANLLGQMVAFAAVLGATLKWALMIVLAAGIVLADPVQGTTAFWQTRPHRRPLFAAAKFVALLAVVFLPMLANQVALVSAGAGWPVLWTSAMWDTLCDASVVFGAAALAMTAENYGEFALRSLLILVAASALAGAVLYADAAQWVSRFYSSGFSLGSSLLLGGRVTAATLGAVIVLGGYLQRHARRMTAWVFAGACASLLVPVWWQWDVFGRLRQVRESVTMSVPHLQFAATGARLLPDGRPGQWAVSADVPVPWNAAGDFAVPLYVSHIRTDGGRWRGVGDGDQTVQFDVHWPASTSALARALAPMRLLQAPTTAPPLLNLQPIVGSQAHWAPTYVSATVFASIRRFVVEARLPLRPGAHAAAGPNEYRILGWYWDNPGQLRVRLRAAYGRSTLISYLYPQASRVLGHMTSTTSPLLFAAGDQRRVVGMEAANEGPVQDLELGSVCVLANPNKGEAIFSEIIRNAGLGSRGGLFIRNVDVLFTGDHLDPEWIQHGKLMILNAAEVGKMTAPLDIHLPRPETERQGVGFESAFPMNSARASKWGLWPELGSTDKRAAGKCARMAGRSASG